MLSIRHKPFLAWSGCCGHQLFFWDKKKPSCYEGEGLFVI